MEVYKRPDSPAWYVDLVHPATGKRRRVSTGETTKAKAQKVAHRMMAEAEGEAAEVRSGRAAVTLRQTLDAYVAHIASQGKSCTRFYELLRDKALGLREPFDARWHLDPARYLHTLTAVDMDDLGRARRAEGNGPQTIAHEIKLIRAATRHAAGLRKRAPQDLVEGLSGNFWRLPKLTMKTRYLSPDEFQAVFDYLSPDRMVAARRRTGKNIMPYVLLGLQRIARQDVQDLLVGITMCGGRWSEVAQLTWDQVDLDAGTMRLWGSKTQKERMVPLPEAAKAVLIRRKAEAKAGCPFIYPGRDGGARRAGSCQTILRAMEAVGLNRPDIVERHGRATVHSLRHTFATWARANGADLDEVQQALGHTTLQMTTRYAHLGQDAVNQKLARIMDATIPVS